MDEVTSFDTRHDQIHSRQSGENLTRIRQRNVNAFCQCRQWPPHGETTRRQYFHNYSQIKT